MLRKRIPVGACVKIGGKTMATKTNINGFTNGNNK